MEKIRDEYGIYYIWSEHLKCITDLWQNWISDDLMALSSKVIWITVKSSISNLVTVVQQIPYILLTGLYLAFPEIRLWVCMICIKKETFPFPHPAKNLFWKQPYLLLSLHADFEISRTFVHEHRQFYIILISYIFRLNT